MPFLLPNVVKAITDQAPLCSIAFLHSSHNSFEDLQKGYIDFLINPKSLVPRGSHFMPLHAFDQVILVRKTHPLVEIYRQKGTVNPEDLKHYERILVNDSYAATQNNDIYLSNYDRYFMTDNVRSENPHCCPVLYRCPVLLGKHRPDIVVAKGNCRKNCRKKSLSHHHSQSTGQIRSNCSMSFLA